jgi:hypothetical protein
MRNASWLALLGVLFLSQSALAQSPSLMPGDKADRENQALQFQFNELSLANESLLQLGSFSGLGLSPEAQSTELIQRGMGNDAQIATSGQSNLVQVQQIGNYNRYDLNLKGRNNDLSLIQNGNFNEVDQTFQNISNLNLDVIQLNNNNGLEMGINQTNFNNVLPGSTSQPIEIKQMGNMTLEINQINQLIPINQ